MYDTLYTHYSSIYLVSRILYLTITQQNMEQLKLFLSSGTILTRQTCRYQLIITLLPSTKYRININLTSVLKNTDIID
jgi:hypothetical protein